MKLVLLNKPSMHCPPAVQKVIVTYDSSREITLIDMDVDIVTLGIAVNVLQEQYELYLKQLRPDVAEKIRHTTRKAVHDAKH